MKSNHTVIRESNFSDAADAIDLVESARKILLDNGYVEGKDFTLKALPKVARFIRLIDNGPRFEKIKTLLKTNGLLLGTSVRSGMYNITKDDPDLIPTGKIYSERMNELFPSLVPDFTYSNPTNIKLQYFSTLYKYVTGNIPDLGACFNTPEEVTQIRGVLRDFSYATKNDPILSLLIRDSTAAMYSLGDSLPDFIRNTQSDVDWKHLYRAQIVVFLKRKVSRSAVESAIQKTNSKIVLK